MFRVTWVVAAVLATASFLIGEAVAAPPIEITSCSQPDVHGRAFLSADLTCSGPGHAIIFHGRTTFQMNGFTVRAGPNRAGFLCLGKKRCKIIGPGTIADSGLGVHSTSAMLVDIDIVDVDVGVEAESCGKVKLKDSTITNSAVVGILADRSVKLTRSSITASGGNGIAVIGDDDCPRGKLKLRHSDVTGSGGGDPACGVSVTCADLAALQPPKVRGTSTCGTSYDLNSGFPGASWGVCSSD